jgi:hypothetical protein
MDFFEYIANLAPEGETALFVRQTPIKHKGELQFHADGAIKATWPAFFPNHKRKDGEAWYGNTASFIIDRFGEKPSASAANCEYVLVMVLDDVGDPQKAPKLPPLAPTWIMETSPGSFQWGYAFSEQPTKSDFAAAIKAIAAAGYTDPGACNPVRNYRLPGSVNLKPGKNGFKAKLIEFNPEQEYTLEYICAALQVTPEESSSLGPAPIKLKDDGGDDVFRWLNDQGLILRKPNPEGWAGVVCPNSAEHTDGNPEGRYNPSARAYCCLHSHCLELDSTTFLSWVALQGGPKHEPGVRDELIASTMSAALEKLNPEAAAEMFTETPEAVLAEIGRKELGRLEKAGWFERFAYIQTDDCYFDLQDRREVARSTFNALFRHIDCTSIHSARKVEASVAYDQNREAMGAKTLLGVTYAAGEGLLVARDGGIYGNRWRDARPALTTGNPSVKPWLDHVERMIPTDFEREHFLNVLAYKIQHPNRKINHAMLIGGYPGSGKDTMLAPFFWAIGGDSKTNCSLVRNEDLTSQWGYALECEVMEIAELRQAEARDRRALENSLKPIIAAPPEFLTVHRKGLHPYESLNRVLVIAFTNERAAISIPSDDRRWFCLWSDAGRLPEADAQALWGWYKGGNGGNGGNAANSNLNSGMAAVAAYLRARDVSNFNPGATPPMTEAKAIMVDQGRSTAESYLVELITGRLGEFASGVIASPFYALCDRLAGAAPTGAKIPQVALLHALREAGWIDCGRLMSREYTTKKHIFCAPELATRPKTELRAMVESVPAPATVKLVKA